MEQSTTVHEPEQIDAEAAELQRQVDAQREAARAARGRIEDARHDAERAYWVDQISRFYSEQRPRVEEAWSVFYAALVEGDAAAALAGWIAYQKVVGEVRSRHRTLSGKAKQYGIPGMRPQLAIPKRRTFAEAVEDAAQDVNAKADTDVQKELAAGAAAAARDAEATARAGEEQPERVTDRAPVAVFACQQYPEMNIAASAVGSLRFRDGVLYVYSEEEAAAARGSKHAVEVSKEEAEQVRTAVRARNRPAVEASADAAA